MLKYLLSLQPQNRDFATFVKQIKFKTHASKNQIIQTWT